MFNLDDFNVKEKTNIMFNVHETGALTITFECYHSGEEEVLITDIYETQKIINNLVDQYKKYLKEEKKQKLREQLTVTKDMIF